eukprot:1149044-Pelagomonas_calceolata.AAC.2
MSDFSRFFRKSMCTCLAIMLIAVFLVQRFGALGSPAEGLVCLCVCVSEGSAFATTCQVVFTSETKKENQLIPGKPWNTHNVIEGKEAHWYGKFMSPAPRSDCEKYTTSWQAGKEDGSSIEKEQGKKTKARRLEVQIFKQSQAQI